MKYMLILSSPTCFSSRIAMSESYGYRHHHSQSPWQLLVVWTTKFCNQILMMGQQEWWFMADFPQEEWISFQMPVCSLQWQHAGSPCAQGICSGMAWALVDMCSHRSAGKVLGKEFPILQLHLGSWVRTLSFSPLIRQDFILLSKWFLSSLHTKKLEWLKACLHYLR